ncbi:hypothetical protein PFICI_00225 [Pestalotiopsis fici W106-1]|uniref:RGS domain-containing protein n=1 Tax=Pestalotiopsis fici (strain W106-1 / CGMCC3.15140) TaxID=1229662 RepID=W3XLQ6_PESFW|nr:uncharacterized protein PFICI_00225 [Pestalotiopsis fici W106-1]ETS86397.1 hypothetical protein PFICI_00225 [Pestalotiopsis fici W106-1]
MGSIQQVSPLDRVVNSWQEHHDRSENYEHNRPNEPRGLSFQLPEIDTDFIDPGDADAKVYWPLPDQYEREPESANMPPGHEYTTGIKAAQDVVTMDQHGKKYTRAWESPQINGSSANGRFMFGKETPRRVGGGWATSSKGNSSSPMQRAVPGILRSKHLARVKEPGLAGSSTPPPISRSRRYVFESDDELPSPISPDSFGPRPPTAPQPYTRHHFDDAARASREIERPRTAIRSDRHVSPRILTPKRQHSDQGGSSRTQSRSPTTDDSSRQVATPALDRVLKFEEAEKHQTTGKAPNFSLRRTGHLRPIVTDLPRREEQPQLQPIVTDIPPRTETHDFYVRNDRDSAIGMSDQSRSTRDQYPGSPSHENSMLSHSSSRRSEGSTHHPADFFSQGIFQVVIHNPATAYQLQKFCETQFCGENVEFLQKVEFYRTTVNNLAGILADIHKTFVSNQSRKQVNVPGDLMEAAHNDMKSLVTNTLPSMESMFDGMQQKIEQLLFDDIYPRFVRHQVTMETARSLTTDRYRYQGLGDCFCLSSPAQADNPVVYASDGFVKVTGYSRSEVIPRNCRFLQGPQTDRTAIKRLRRALREERESVELLLNYKKDGTPFWNLLYMAPLCDDNGNVVFFLGGQINCSTTIHTNVDVMRVLSVPCDTPSPEELRLQQESMQQQQFQASMQHPKRRSFFKNLISNALPTSAPSTQQSPSSSSQSPQQHEHGQPGQSMPTGGPLGFSPAPTSAGSEVQQQQQQSQPGLEGRVLDRMGGRDLMSQMQEFYSAYSKYIVVRAENFSIKFYSAEIVESLVPTNTGPSNEQMLPPGSIGPERPPALARPPVVGQDIFRYFKQHQPGTIQADFKSSVKKAIKSGMPASAGIRLQTRRSAAYRGDENFMTHWTPLKNEHGAVHWVVVTLASLTPDMQNPI